MDTCVWNILVQCVLSISPHTLNSTRRVHNQTTGQHRACFVWLSTNLTDSLCTTGSLFFLRVRKSETVVYKQLDVLPLKSSPSDIGGGGNHVILWPLRVQGIPCEPNCFSNHFQTWNSGNTISRMSSFMDSIVFIERRRLFSALGFQNESPISSTWRNVLHYCKCAPYPRSPSLAAIKHWGMPQISLGDSLIQNSW